MNELNKETKNKNRRSFCGFLFITTLWLLIWGTYNTEIGLIFIPGFPHNFLELFHGLRTALPFIALIAVIIFLFRKRRLPGNFFLTPPGLLLIYAIFGSVSSVFSKEPLMALYWSVLYGIVSVVLLAALISPEPLKKLSLIININWAIAGILGIALFVFFLVQPGVLSSIHNNFLICSQRPYESLGNIPAGLQTLGMVGTRTTGFGRYIAVAALISFVSSLYFKKRLKYFWLALFIIFTIILFFSKARTEIIGFMIAMVFISLLMKRFRVIVLLAAAFVAGWLLLVNIYYIPCNPINSTDQTVVSAVNPPGGSIQKILTLSTRTSEIWPKGFELFSTSPLLGYGFQADRFFLNGLHAHNTILQALVQAGLFGTIPFILAFILTFISLYKLFRKNILQEKEKYFLIAIAGVLVFIVVRGITESVAFFSADWLFAAPIIACIQCLKDGLNDVRKNDSEEIPSFKFCGSRINVIQIPKTLECISSWIKSGQKKARWVVVSGMHGVVEAYKNENFRKMVNSADLFVPDGISWVWRIRNRGFDIKKRVSGADLMTEFFKVASKEGFSSYFYGDTEDTLQALNKKLLTDFLNLKIAGSYSPPFRKLTEKEDAEIIEKINQAKPDVLWVALGLPKQEKWIFEHREKLNVPVVIGVGAAFKFLSGKIKRAPKWIGDMGFEWLWRLLHEPKITWKRVFLDGPFFIWLIMLELIGSKRYKE